MLKKWNYCHYATKNIKLNFSIKHISNRYIVI